MKVYYVFCNGEFYAYLFEKNWHNYKRRNHIMSQESFRVYTITV
jgi:hypothetical protein